MRKVSLRRLKVAGVQAVDRTSTVVFHKLLVRAIFRDADQAQSIHSKVMNKIVAAKQFQVRGITANLSECLFVAELVPGFVGVSFQSDPSGSSRNCRLRIGSPLEQRVAKSKGRTFD